MTKVQEKQVKRLTITTGNAASQNCGAFIDFFLDKGAKGQVLSAAGGEFDKHLREN